MLAAAKDESVPLLAAVLLAANSRRDHQLPTAILHPGIGFVNSNTATGLHVRLYDEGRGSRSTGEFGHEIWPTDGHENWPTNQNTTG